MAACYYTLYVVTPAKGLQKQTVKLNSQKEFGKLFGEIPFLSFIDKNGNISFWDHSITGGRISFLCWKYREDYKKRSHIGSVCRALAFNEKKEG